MRFASAALLFVVALAALMVILRPGYAGTPSFSAPGGSAAEKAPAKILYPPAQADSASTTASSTAATVPEPAIQTTPQTRTMPLLAAEPSAAPAPAPPSQSTIDASAQKLRSGLVNILCSMQTSGDIRSISGSGMLVDPRGVILTNAHVAQFFLLRDYPSPDAVECVIRAGSPATAHYRAELLYLPPAWIDANAAKIATPEATSTGQDDYAFLLITSEANGAPLPASTTLPAVSLTTDAPALGDPAIVAAYPAQYLNSASVEDALYASSVVTTVDAFYTFALHGTTLDEIAAGGSVISQSGSSGGGVARPQDGAVYAMITTQSEGTTTASREINAITVSHIDRSLAQYGQGGISTLLSGDLAQKAAAFDASIAPGLTQKLISVLEGK